MSEEGNKLAKKAIRSSYLSSIVSISLVLFLIGILGVLVLNAKRLSDYFKENFQVTVLLKPNAGDEEIKTLVTSISSNGFIKSATLVTEDEAAKKLSEELGEDFVSFLGKNPLSNTIDVTFKAAFADNATIENFVNTYNNHRSIQEIRYEPTLMEAINKNIRRISLIILGFGALLFFIMGVLINHTIRLSLYARRMLIKSMQLVGATRGFIRKPFMKKGILSGFYGAVLANLFLIGLLYFAQKQIPELFGIEDIKLVATLMLSVIIAGILISGVSTLLAVNKYLAKRTDELF
ncbi:MAG TPA: permease-like cell division protein FtsX [Bacteroidia bacterium]|nr:permease-like cell division protein FtsX [Bacteroidia bacterium]